MMQYMEKSPYRIVARFIDAEHADIARQEVNAVLRDAQGEIDDMFHRQEGIAQVCDVNTIYARYGFRNESGWQQTRTIRTTDDELIWELPDGMFVEDAQGLLAAYGALTITVDSTADDNLIQSVPHPAALYLSESDEDFEEIEDDDLTSFIALEKKILH